LDSWQEWVIICIALGENDNTVCLFQVDRDVKEISILITWRSIFGRVAHNSEITYGHKSIIYIHLGFCWLRWPARRAIVYEMTDNSSALVIHKYLSLRQW
jgi:hypothetical protein